MAEKFTENTERWYFSEIKFYQFLDLVINYWSTPELQVINEQWLRKLQLSNRKYISMHYKIIKTIPLGNTNVVTVNTIN